MTPTRNFRRAPYSDALSAVALAISFLLVSGCGSPAHLIKPDKVHAVEPVLGIVVPPVVSLQIQPTDLKAVGTKTVTTWMATYGTGAQAAQFELELTQGEMEYPPTPDNNPNMPKLEYGEGAFINVSGSNSSSLVQALAKVLEAKSIPSHRKNLSRLPFTYVVLGENQTRSSNGSFIDSPPGAWRAMKFFLGNGDNDDGEFFFNMNPQTGQAEFAENDPDYGDYDVKQLASVL